MLNLNLFKECHINDRLFSGQPGLLKYVCCKDVRLKKEPKELKEVITEDMWQNMLKTHQTTCNSGVCKEF